MSSVLLMLMFAASPQVDASKTVVGQAICKNCHADTHAKWQNSRHSKMVQPATTEGVKGDFSKALITLRGDTYGLRTEGGKFYITEAFFGRDLQEHEIQYTLGNRRIQHYLTTLEDGRIIVLPPSWDELRQEWFHNLEIAAPDQQEGIIPVQLWNKNCFGCHVSEEVKNYDADDRRYATEWLDFGGHCERCHGPGSAHVALYSSDVTAASTSPEIVVPTKLDNERNSQVCAQCHSFRDVMHSGYTAGQDYYDYFMPLLEYGMGPSSDPTWWPDGKTRRFSTNALGIWQSECFLKGKVACTSCHVDTHEPEIELNEQLRPENRNLCTRCHEEIGANIAAHTFHDAASAGSSCVECHMPRSVVSIKARMRDHSISIPAPENTIRHEIPNACNLCHKDQSPEWAIAALDIWYPENQKRQKVIRRADAFVAARNKEPGAVPQLLALVADKEQGPIPRANAIGHLGNFDDPRVFPTLVGAAKDEHPLVRATAALKLGDRGQPNRDTAVMVLGSAVADDRRIVRMNAAISLLNLGVQKLAGEAGRRFEEAKADHIARGAFHADDAPQLANLGRFHVLAGDGSAAAEAFENSYKLNPDQPGIKFFMAVTRVSQSRPEDAKQFLEEVDEDDPFAEEAQDLLRKLQAPH